MGKRLDLSGQIYGHLTAIKPAENIKGRSAWLCKCQCGNECVVTTKDLRSGKRTTCGCRWPGLESLHYIDGTCIEMIRSKTVRSNNKSGVPGVFFDKSSGKWRVEIMFQGKRKCLGRFSHLSDAIKARLAEEEKLHDEYVAAYLEEHEETKEKTGLE